MFDSASGPVSGARSGRRLAGRTNPVGCAIYLIMKVKTLCQQTAQIFINFNGNVIEHDDYNILQTPSNPGYHWGNYIIFKNAPQKGSYTKWIELFRNSFPYYKTFNHFAFTWDTHEKGDVSEFLANGYELEESVTLKTDTLVLSKNLNSRVEVRALTTDQDWEAATLNQLACTDPKYLNAGNEKFKREQMTNYRKMTQAKMGHWFGAFLDNKFVGDLGIFTNGKVARFQNVGTHPSARRQGVCATLVYEAARIFKKEFNIDRYVMEADPDYHAARIYESVGFKRCETTYQLSWWNNN